MSGTKISALPSAGTLDGNELVPVVNDPGGTPATTQTTVDAIAARATSNGAVPTSRTVSAGTGLNGGGDLSANRTLSIAVNAVTDTLLRDSAGLSVIGRSVATTGDPADIVAGSDHHVLRRSGTALGFGPILTANIQDGAVTLAKMANLTAPAIVGRTTAGAGVPEALTAAQATALLDTFTSSLKGLAPASGGGTTNFLRADGTWAAPAGGGSAPSGYVAGNWIIPYFGTTGASATLGANAIKFIPFRLDRSITVTGLGCRVTTGAASSSLQLAIYANNASTGRPTGTALISTGNLSSAAAALVSETSLGPVTLDAGVIYWAAINNGSASIQVQAVLSANVGQMSRLVGASDLNDILSAAANALVMLELAQTFGSWPDATGGSFTVSTSGRQAVIALQIGTLP